MPGITQGQDLTTQYQSYGRETFAFRPVAGASYLPGTLVEMASVDLQTYPDAKTIVPTAIAANQSLLAGVVSETWPGFSGSLGPAVGTFVAAANLAASRGTLGIDLVTKGYHPAILVDQSGTGAVTLTNGLPIIASRATVGYGQGAAITASSTAIAALASLPASGFGSSLPAAALAQASQTDTLTGAPSTGDILQVTIQGQWNNTTPGVVQTIAFTAPALTSAQAATVTTAAAALAAYLNSQPLFSAYFIATAAAGVVTITVNALAAPFLLTFGPGIVSQAVSNSLSFSLSGALGNALSFAVATVSGTTVSTAGGATLAGGTGYKGTVPGYVSSLL